MVSDHEPLKWIGTLDDPGKRLTRWKWRMRKYDYEFVHKSGKLNVNADALSRNPVISDESSSSESENDIKTLKILPLKSNNKNSSSDSGTKGPSTNSCKPSTSRLRNPRLDTTSNQSTIASRTRSRLRTVPTVPPISETDESSTEVSRPPIQRLHHSTLPTPLLPPKRPVGRPRKHLIPEPETKKNQNIHVETPIVSVELSSGSDDSEDSVLEEPIHSSINITQPKQSSETLVLSQDPDPAEVSRTDNIPVPL